MYEFWLQYYAFSVVLKLNRITQWYNFHSSLFPFSFASDGDFHMFDSGIWYTDLIFSDDAVRLMPIPKEKQNYKDWLGESFLAQIENLHRYTCVNPDAAGSLSPSGLLISSLFAVVSVAVHQLQLWEYDWLWTAVWAMGENVTAVCVYVYICAMICVRI